MMLGVLTPAGRSEAYSLVVVQPGNYKQGGCPPNDNVDDYSYPIRNGAAALGWSVVFWGASNAWPQDFMDPGDSADYYDNVVFLGHGNSGQQFFSVPHDGVCSAGATTGNYWCDPEDPPCSNTQLAAGTGAKASSVVMMACCYMEINRTALLTNHHHEKQMMGFGGISSIDAPRVQNYWDRTGVTSNVDAWLNSMEDKPGWFTGDNTTVVMSRGHSEEERAWNRWYCGMKRQNCVDGGDGGGYWYLDWHWHGCGGCAACPQG